MVCGRAPPRPPWGLQLPSVSLRGPRLSGRIRTSSDHPGGKAGLQDRLTVFKILFLGRLVTKNVIDDRGVDNKALGPSEGCPDPSHGTGLASEHTGLCIRTGLDLEAAFGIIICEKFW